MDHIDRDYRIVCGEKVLLIRGASGNVTLSLPAKMTANDMVKAWLKKGTASAY
ncbi:MAG: hypothetical protein J0I17_11325 ['Candidatus Kapabacteria' thiocyanatum]|nr:hypothetical protein ['Candidatus Kapabacteria' thiocyanatum]